MDLHILLLLLLPLDEPVLCLVIQIVQCQILLVHSLNISCLTLKLEPFVVNCLI